MGEAVELLNHVSWPTEVHNTDRSVRQPAFLRAVRIELKAFCSRGRGEGKVAARSPTALPDAGQGLLEACRSTGAWLRWLGGNYLSWCPSGAAMNPWDYS